MIRFLRMAFAALLLALAVPPAFAVLPDEVLDDPALEERARDLSAMLRCMVCQNQSIDDSDADLARDLRILVRERLLAGDSDEEVVAYIVSRYGEYVLLNPTARGSGRVRSTACADAGAGSSAKSSARAGARMGPKHIPAGTDS